MCFIVLKKFKNKKFKSDPLVYISLNHTKIMIQIECCHCHCCQYKHGSLNHSAGTATLIRWQKINLAEMGWLTRGLWLQLALIYILKFDIILQKHNVSSNF